MISGGFKVMNEEKKTKEQTILNDVRQRLRNKGQEYASYCSVTNPSTRTILLFILIAILIALGFVFVGMKNDTELNNMNNYYLGKVYCDCGEIITSEQRYCINCGTHTGQAKVEPYKECLQCDRLYNPNYTYCKLCGEQLVHISDGKMITLEELGIESFLGVSNIHTTSNIFIFGCVILMAIVFVCIILVFKSILYGYKLYTTKIFASEMLEYINNALYALEPEE